MRTKHTRQLWMPEEALPCPTCKARAGEICVSAEGRQRPRPHTPRVDAYHGRENTRIRPPSAIEQRYDCPFCKVPAGRRCVHRNGKLALVAHSARRKLEGAGDVCETFSCRARRGELHDKRCPMYGTRMDEEPWYVNDPRLKKEDGDA